MLTTEEQQLLMTIIDHTITKQPCKFQLIVNWESYRYYRNRRKAYKLIIKGLQKSSDRLLKKYCADVITRISNFNTLLAYHQLKNVMEFYQIELDIIKDMLDEYETYVFSGNFFTTFLGFSRAAEDMYDYRKKD